MKARPAADADDLEGLPKPSMRADCKRHLVSCASGPDEAALCKIVTVVGRGVLTMILNMLLKRLCDRMVHWMRCKQERVIRSRWQQEMP
eukprot:13914240-Heterocapsa_arctica.AAC.1